MLISVPDLVILFELYLKKDISMEDRWLTRVIYGAQSDEFDYHKVGFDYHILMPCYTKWALGSERVEA